MSKDVSRGALKERIVELERSLKLAEAAIQKAAAARLLSQVKAESFGARFAGCWMTLNLGDEMLCTKGTRGVCQIFVETVVLELSDVQLKTAVESALTGSYRYGAAREPLFGGLRQKRQAEGHLIGVRAQTPQEAEWFREYHHGNIPMPPSSFRY